MSTSFARPFVRSSRHAARSAGPIRQAQRHRPRDPQVPPNRRRQRRPGIRRLIGRCPSGRGRLGRRHRDLKPGGITVHGSCDVSGGSDDVDPTYPSTAALEVATQNRSSWIGNVGNTKPTCIRQIERGFRYGEVVVARPWVYCATQPAPDYPDPKRRPPALAGYQHGRSSWWQTPSLPR